MCGIVGAIVSTDSSLQLMQAIEQIKFRGPDAQGSFIDSERGVFLGHTRLAIIDLSEAGSQPMTSSDGNLTIIFNGEIYNHVEMRLKLQGLALRGSSDTEVLLENIARYGLEESLSQARGMFALALYNRKEGGIYLARDRYGEKPLYVANIGGGVAFSSDARALRQFGEMEIDRDSIADFMRFGYVPGPSSIWKNCWKLPPASFCKLNINNPNFEIAKIIHFDELPEVEINTHEKLDDVLTEFENKFDESVRLQMMADVPVGAFLSGGLDSSLVVSSMKKFSDKVKTFSLGIADQPADESIWAEKIASYFGTTHRSLLVSAEDVAKSLEEANRCYDEPFADPSQIPMWIVSGLARKDVKVCLSGDAVDEVFGGYSSYRRLLLINKISYFIPASLARYLSTLSLFSYLDRFIGPYSGYRIRKMFNVISKPDTQSRFDAITFLDKPGLVIGGNPREGKPWRLDSVKGAQLQDIQRYLVDNILVKTDRVTMAHGLECRVPMLDHSLFKWCWSLPSSIIWKGRSNKFLVRALLSKRLPETFFKRPKQGFGLPLQRWLKNELKWLVDLHLNEENVNKYGVLDYKVLKSAIDAYETGIDDNKSLIWNALCLHLWLRRHLEKA